MKQYRLQKLGRFFGPVSVLAPAGLCAVLLSSCAVSSPLAVQSTFTEVSAQNMEIAISLPEDGDEALKTRFASALMNSLSNSGIATSPDGLLIADYAVSTGMAEVGVQSSLGGEDGSIWIAPPRPAKRFDQCEAMVLRGSLLLLDRNTGATVYRGTGTMTDCDFADDALRAMADGLVSDFATRQ